MLNPPQPTAESVAKLFGASVENVRRQYALNAAQLRQMAKRAGAGKYNGFTADQWNGMADTMQAKADA